MSAGTFRVGVKPAAPELVTDDWVEAERYASDALNGHPSRVLSVFGTHPTHDFGPPLRAGFRDPTRTCRGCGIPDNGCYGSHAPCGYDFEGRSLLAALDIEEAKRDGARLAKIPAEFADRPRVQEALGLYREALAEWRGRKSMTNAIRRDDALKALYEAIGREATGDVLDPGGAHG